MQDLLPFPDGSEREPIGPQQSFTFEHLIRIVSEKLDRLHSGQLVLCAQVKDLRESLPVQRRPLSRFAADTRASAKRQARRPLPGL
jgi:hypothetical protein